MQVKEQGLILASRVQGSKIQGGERLHAQQGAQALGIVTSAGEGAVSCRRGQ